MPEASTVAEKAAKQNKCASQRITGNANFTDKNSRMRAVTHTVQEVSRQAPRNRSNKDIRYCKTGRYHRPQYIPALCHQSRSGSGSLPYDLWNVAYCYNCIATRAMYAGVALLISCTLAEFFVRRGIWLQHRARTLALFGMFSLAVDYQAMPAFGITATYNPAAWTVLSALALVFNAGVFAYEVYMIVKTRRNLLKQELYTELADYQKNLAANGLK